MHPAESAPLGSIEGQDGVCRLVLAIGQAGFLDRLARECDALYKADQITAFLVEDERARCILAHRPDYPQRVQSLARSYTRIFAPRDALLGATRKRGVDFAAARLASADIADEAYRHRLFNDVGLQSKIAVYSRHDGRELYINFYFRGVIADNDAALSHLNTYGRLLAACLHRHESLTGGSFKAGAARARVRRVVFDRFPALSAREAQVAAAICCGLSTEAIALELTLARSSIVTLRRRAYRKMAIGSRGELFAAVAGLSL
jgi:DNA-binding CsgD family transcriptional regulator